MLPRQRRQHRIPHGKRLQHLQSTSFTYIFYTLRLYTTSPSSGWIDIRSLMCAAAPYIRIPTCLSVYALWKVAFRTGEQKKMFPSLFLSFVKLAGACLCSSYIYPYTRHYTSRNCVKIIFCYVFIWSFILYIYKHIDLHKYTFPIYQQKLN